MTADAELSDIVLLLGNIEGTEDILGLSDNSRFSFTPEDGADNEGWCGGQRFADLTGPFLCLMFGRHMFSPEGWICGSWPDSEQCDLQLAKDNRTGVSRRHFRVDIEPEAHRPRLTNISRNPMRIHDSTHTKTIQLEPKDRVEITFPVIIDLGEVRLRAWRPDLSCDNGQRQRYKRNAELFHRDYMGALPRSAIGSSVPTLDIRFGLSTNNAYKREGADIGAGTFASVMKVRELKSGTYFAAKVPHYRVSDAPGKARNRWESLSKEFQKLTTLKHDHIVQAVEVLMGRDATEPPWLIMEWMSHDLRSAILEDDEIPDTLRQVSSGLAFMHSHCFAHRDLKPENILVQRVTGRLVAKIADVGLSKYSTTGRMQTFAGSIAYMAPEVWNSDQPYTNAVDMWSLGVIAIELWTRWDLLLDSTVKEMAWSRDRHHSWIRTDLESRVDRAPAPLPLILRGLLSVSPGERWSARVCEEWLDAKARTFISFEGTPLGEERRHLRSTHPTLSTTRANEGSLRRNSPFRSMTGGVDGRQQAE